MMYEAFVNLVYFCAMVAVASATAFMVALFIGLLRMLWEFIDG